MEHKLSVIIPCYNAEQYIDKCVQSLINQTFGLDNLELIFINDASKDNTMEILKKYEQLYPDNIMLIDLVENIKQGGARNIGLQYATTNYIAFVDADDWIEKTMYEKLYSKAVEYDCDMVSCKFKRIIDNDLTMGRTGKPDHFHEIKTVNDRRRFLLDGVGGGIWCNIYKKQLIIDNQIFFPEKITYEDNFWLPVLQLYINSYYVIEEYLYNYYYNTNSTIATIDSLHHFDRLFIELMKIEEFKQRGVLALYYQEIEFKFLKLYFLNTLNLMFTRYTVIPKGILEEMQRTVLKCFPDYKNNGYIEKRMSETDRYILQIIEMEITPDELEELAYQYRNGYFCIPKK